MLCVRRPQPLHGGMTLEWRPCVMRLKAIAITWENAPGVAPAVLCVWMPQPSHDGMTLEWRPPVLCDWMPQPFTWWHAHGVAPPAAWSQTASSSGVLMSPLDYFMPFILSTKQPHYCGTDTEDVVIKWKKQFIFLCCMPLYSSHWSARYAMHYAVCLYTQLVEVLGTLCIMLYAYILNSYTMHNVVCLYTQLVEVLGTLCIMLYAYIYSTRWSARYNMHDVVCLYTHLIEVLGTPGIMLYAYILNSIKR